MSETYVNNSPLTWVLTIGFLVVFVATWVWPSLSRRTGWGRTPARRLQGVPAMANPVGPASEESSQMAAFAASVGWTYEPTSTQVPLPNLVPAAIEALLALGGQVMPTPHDVIRGTRAGHDVIVYRYVAAESWRSRGARDKQADPFVVVAVRTPVPLPYLYVGLRGWSENGGVMGAIGEVNMESDDFNRSFAVMCADDKLAYDVLNPRSMERLLAFPTQLMTSGAYLLATLPGGFDVTTLESCMDTAIGIVDDVPPFVWTDLERAQGPGSPPPIT